MKRTLLWARVLGAVFIFAVELTLLSIGPVSCSMGGEEDGGGLGLKIQTAAPPVLQAFEIDSADGMLLRFDKAVSVTDASLSPSGTVEPVIGVSCEDAGEEGSVRLLFAEQTKIGSSYDMKAVAHDADGNSLSFTISFDGYNDRLPDLLICEVRNAYSSKKDKYEFVKLYCAKDGNLSGLELLSAGDGESKAFAFPPVEVKSGEYITVHLRKMKDEAGNWKQAGMTDEDGGDIRASTAVDSSADAWDFWQDNQKSRLSPSDVVVIRRKTDGKVFDALLFRDPKKEGTDWDAKYRKLCDAVEKSGRWLDSSGQPSAGFESAFVATGITSSAVTKTLKRRSLDLHPSSASDWAVAQTR
ncbi:MAG: hypothetical protein IJU95_09865 [Treponema sp.]|nr:hypothetical protein [Treponema sp.]